MVGTISGTRDGVLWPKRGEFITLPDAEAEDLIAAGICAADEPEEKAVAVHKDEEHATARRSVKSEEATAKTLDGEATKRTPRSRKSAEK